MLSKSAEAVLFIINYVRQITKTKLVKMLFLADRKAVAETNEPITDLEYVKYFYGPYPKEIERILNELYAMDYVDFTENISDKGRRYYLIISQVDNVKYPQLSSKDKEVLKSICQKYKNKSLEEILDEVYKLDEVKSTSFGERLTV